MEGTKSATFRPTVWPAEPPTTPGVSRGELVTEPKTGALYVAANLGSVDLPPDFVLQELHQLKPATAADVVDIAAEWGLASGAGARTFDYLAGEPPRQVAADLEAWEALTGRRGLIHPGAVEIHLAALRTLSRHALAYLEGQPDEAIVGAWRPDGFAVPETVEQAWFWWEHYMNRGLAAFTVHVRTRGDLDSTLSRPSPNLYNACCLQLAQYLAMNGTVLRCANERCRKPFTRQRGRARDEYGQHRSRGVRYCSHLCAKAQSERDRRRRRAEESK